MEILAVALTLVVTVSIIWALLGCVSCRQKPSEEEVQRKHFEKFRKSHIAKDKGLCNGVDVIRTPVGDGEPNNRTVSVISAAGDHTYEDIMSFNKLNHDAPPSREHSFFDESFDHVVEGSSSSTASNPSSCHGNQGEPLQRLCVPSTAASYLSLQAYSSRSCLTGDSMARISPGEVNSAFLEASLANTEESQLPAPEHNDTYLVPIVVPRINIIQPTFRKPNQPSKKPKQSSKNNDRKEVTPSKHVPDVFNFEKSHCVNINDFSDCKIQNDEMRFKNLQKLLMEGPTNHTEARRQSYDSSQTLYEKLRDSRLENDVYKSLNNLVLPSRRSYLPKNSKGSSQSSDHTYESITAELSGEMLRGGAHDLYDDDSPLPQHGTAYDENQCFRTPSKDLKRKSVTFEGLNDLNKCSENTYDEAYDHTYESLRDRFSQSCTSQSSPDLSVVIIGKRKNGFYDSIRSSNFRDKMLHEGQQDNIPANHEFKKPWTDSTDRYSPYPTKLAIKSSFRPIASPRWLNVETLPIEPSPFRISEEIRNLRQSCRQFNLENRDVKTPEIFVEDATTVFYSPKKQYIQSFQVMDDRETAISPMCTYQTLKNRTNLKLKRNSLPSISDQLEAEIRSHCDIYEYQSSTPFELPDIQINCIQTIV